MTIPPLSDIITTLGGAAGIAAAVKWLVTWWTTRKDEQEKRADGAVEKREAREHAVFDRAVKLLEEQAAASATRADRYAAALHETSTALAEVTVALHALSERVGALDGRASPPPSRLRSLTPAPIAATPATGEYLRGDGKGTP